MQISDMLRQYDRSLSSSSTEELKSASGREKLVSTVKELQTGNIFEGTVSAVRGGKVTLALGNGQTITAQMDGKVNLQIGSPMFFQVKNNDGNTVSIRPYLIEGNSGNPILLNALTSAGIPVNERNMFMVDTMMREQMAIDKQSILDMARIANLNPDVSVKTVVEMVKLDIPVSKAMAMQYENYLGDRQSILQEVNQAMDDLAGQVGNAELPAEAAVRLNQEIIDIFLSGEDWKAVKGVALEAGTAAKAGTVLEAGAASEAGAALTASTEAGGADKASAGLFTASVIAAREAEAAQTIDKNQMQDELLQMTTEGEAAGAQGSGENARIDGLLDKTNTTEAMGQKSAEHVRSEDIKNAGMQSADGQMATLGKILSEEGLQNLNKLLQNVPTLVENQELFPGAEEIFVDTMQEDGGKLNPQAEEVLPENKKTPMLDADMTVEQFLKAVKLGLAEKQDFGFAGAQKLFASKEYQSLLKNIMEQEWLLTPKELTEENKINELYGRMEHQLKQLESAMQHAGMSTEAFSQTVTGVQNNIEFMNLINQTYTYVQLPLKLSNQNANSELYVYTNKKNLKDPDAEVTAFLHLDMENLGSTDVSVKLHNKHVKTNFYFSDDASFALVQQYLPVLEEALAKKGFTCSLSVNQEEKEMNFVEDFLRKDQPQVGTLHRYSFDVRT